MAKGPTGMSNVVLDVVDLHAGYATRNVLTGVDLRIQRGEWTVLLGANGSGKSTLLDACVGRLELRAGDVRIASHSLLREPIEAKQALGYAIAAERLPTLLTARECLAVQCAAKRLHAVDDEVQDLMQALNLTPWLDEAVALMSYGTRQKLGVLLALVGDPALIVLDESLNGLDAASSLLLKQHLRQRVWDGRVGVLLATHALDIAEHWADRGVLLHEGRIARQWLRGDLSPLDAGGLEGRLAEWLAAPGARAASDSA